MTKFKGDSKKQICVKETYICRVLPDEPFNGHVSIVDVFGDVLLFLGARMTKRFGELEENGFQLFLLLEQLKSNLSIYIIPIVIQFK